MRTLVFIPAMLAAGVPASAAVLQSSTTGFVVESSIPISGSPDAIYAALIQPSLWWDSAHCWSGDARILTFEAKAGGCGYAVMDLEAIAPAVDGVIGEQARRLKIYVESHGKQ